MSFTTRSSMLFRVKNGDEVGWEEFHNLYSNLIYLRAMDFGLSKQEQEDIAQEIMSDLFRKETVFRYNKQKGRFKFFLKKIITNKIFDYLRKKNKQNIESLDDKEYKIPADYANDELDNKWEEEWRKHVLKQAIDELRHRIEPKTFQAFDLFAIQELNVENVSKMLGISTASVYTYKTRAIKQLKDIIKELD